MLRKKKKKRQLVCPMLSGQPGKLRSGCATITVIQIPRRTVRVRSQCDSRECRVGLALRALVGRVCCFLSRVAVGEMDVRKQEREREMGLRWGKKDKPGEVNEPLVTALIG